LRIFDGIACRDVVGERVTLGVIELDPGSIVPEHAHENEQLGVCIQGSMRFRIGAETREVAPGSTWSIGASVPHEVEVGPHGCVVVEVFAPRRDDWREIERDGARPPRWP
jgi:quercetin dioxygenase-like cupin family protein